MEMVVGKTIVVVEVNEDVLVLHMLRLERSAVGGWRRGLE